MHRRLTGLMLCVLGGTLVAACPQTAAVPELEGEPAACTRRDDCNDVACGALRSCVDGFCSAGEDIVVPCR